MVWIRRQKRADESGNHSRIQHLESLQGRHETASDLLELVQIDGAGAWPPRTDFESWPSALRPYHDIYFNIIPLLSTAEPSLDDAVNKKLVGDFRSHMRKLLAEKIDLTRVREIMAAAEAGRWDIFSRDAYNGFYCCIAMSRHAYRWGTIPVVKFAQRERILELPPELDLPWDYLQRNFGITAASGNNTANILLNINKRGERVYKINASMPKLIRSSEETFFRIFLDIEVSAFPIYYEIVCAIISYEDNNRTTCSNYLESISFRLRHLLRMFFENLVEPRVSQSVWLSYVQGFQAWGVGSMVNGELVRYDGLSGNQALIFRALDAFLGMDRYLSDEQSNRYIPVNQRKICHSLRKHSFRKSAQAHGYITIEYGFKNIVNHMRVFRSAHRARAFSYLEQPAPERLVMTAGKSVLEGVTNQETENNLKALDKMLATRFKQTI
ncbi:15-hydroxyprostaglandin dehydrogenase (NAD(+)) protein [Trichophyton interdigitale]|nr:15-hydroxyprostaglandin dehydrogenase (NAD(+)) protein [Trichophyton interdigitale]